MIVGKQDIKKLLKWCHKPFFIQFRYHNAVLFYLGTFSTFIFHVNIELFSNVMFWSTYCWNLGLKTELKDERFVLSQKSLAKAISAAKSLRAYLNANELTYQSISQYAAAVKAERCIRSSLTFTRDNAILPVI